MEEGSLACVVFRMQVPLHPALELIAVYNGFHQMSQLRLKELAAQLDAELRLHSNRTLILNFMPQEKVLISLILVNILHFSFNSLIFVNRTVKSVDFVCF